MSILGNGVAYEPVVARELEARGWDVEPFGQGLLTDVAKRWLHTRRYPARWLPDLIVHRGRVLAFVDAKASVKRDRHTVNLWALEASLHFEEWNGVALWFIFPDGCVIRPGPAAKDAEPGRADPSRGATGHPFVYVYCHRCERIDDIFGRRLP